MSRRNYSYHHPNLGRTLYVVAGWDRPLQTYFIGITDSLDDEHIYNSIWAKRSGDKFTLDDLARVLEEHEIWAPAEFYSVLQQDQDHNTGNATSTIVQPAVNIELRAVRLYHDISEETLAFKASVLIERRRVAEAINNGTGGMSRIHPLQPIKPHMELIERATAALQECDKGPYRHSVSLETVVETLVHLHELKAEARRASKKNRLTLWRFPDDPDRFTFKVEEQPFSPKVAKELQAQHGRLLYFLNSHQAVGPFRIEHLFL